MSRPIPEHGTPARYQGRKNLPGCRCQPCTKGASRADGERRLARLSGNARTADTATVQRVLEHLSRLIVSDMSHEQIAQGAGIAQSTVSDLLSGQSKSLRSSTAVKLLRVRVTDRTETGMVSAVGAMRRLRALYWMGHRSQDVAAETGLHEDTVLGLARGRWEKTTTARVQAVCRAYDKLAMAYGASAHARRFAVKNGWHGPLAWDDDRIDDPQARPYVPSDEDVLAEDAIDPVAVRQFVAGRLFMVRDAEFLEAVRECRAAGLSNGDIDALHGVTRKTTERVLNRIKKAYERAGVDFPELAPSANQAKFTDEQVVKIREQYAAHGGTDLDLAMQYGMTRSAMSALLSGRSYSSAGGPVRETRSAKPTESTKTLWALKTPGSAQSFAQAS